MQRQRPFGAQQPDHLDIDAARGLVGGGMKARDIAGGKGHAHPLPQPRRFTARATNPAKAIVTLFQPPQQFKKPHAVGFGNIAGQIRARLPGRIGHATSSCFCSRRVRVRTKELIPA